MSLPSQLSDNSTCVGYGLSDTSLLAARDAIPLSSPYSSSTSESVFMPVFVSGALADNPTHAVVWMHGLSGDANTYYCSGVAATQQAGASGSTLSVAPWFGDEQLTLESWLGSAADEWRQRHGTNASLSAYWSTSRWLSGGDNSPSPSRFTTAFDVLDATVQWITDSYSTVERSSFVGFSAGAQLVSRWALFSLAAASVTSVVSDPSSYIYLDARRPADACSPLRDTGAAHSCVSFAAPPDAAGCETYDDYKYGLADVLNVSANLYLSSLNASRLAQAVAAFPRRDVRFLFGTQDVCNCNTDGFANSHAYCYPAAGDGCAPNADGGSVAGHSCCDTYPDSATDNAVDVKCGALLQGSNRLQRGLNFVAYLNDIDPDADVVTATFAGGHNNSGAFFSDALKGWAFAPSARPREKDSSSASTTGTGTVDLMTKGRLGDFEDDGWSGYACTFREWTSCVNSTALDCNAPESTCRRCRITCALAPNKQMQFHFPAGGVFPVAEQFTIPPGTAIVGAANPNDPADKTRQQTDVSAHTWFVVPRRDALCGDDPLCKDAPAKGPTACSGDPTTHRQGFLMSSNSMLKDVNFQGADLGRSGSEGVLCGPGAIELPGCVSGVECSSWGAGQTTGSGVVRNVVVQNVRLSDAAKRADPSQMKGDCADGEALDADGNHVRAHQVSVWVSKLPSAERGSHENVLVDNLVSMNSRADGLNVHGAVRGFTLQHSHIQNSGDDCIGVWSGGIENMTIRGTVAKDCAVTAGAQGNWGSCMGTYAFRSLAVDGLECFDPFPTTAGCPPRTHWTAMHINKAFANDCMPLNATLSLRGIGYFASAAPTTPLARPKCGQCKSCCNGCSEAGFDDLTVTVRDGSVPEGQCKSVSAGCSDAEPSKRGRRGATLVEG